MKEQLGPNDNAASQLKNLSMADIEKLANEMLDDSVLVYQVEEDYSMTLVYYTLGTINLLGHEFHSLEAAQEHCKMERLWGFPTEQAKRIAADQIANLKDQIHVSQINHDFKGKQLVQTHSRVIGQLDGRPIIFVGINNVDAAVRPMLSICDNSNRMLFILEQGTYQILYGNKVFADFMGMEQSAYLGRTCYSCSPYSKCIDSLCPGCRIDEAMQTGKTISVLKKSDNKHYDVQAKPIKWAWRKAIAVFIEERTEEKVATEKKLQSFETRLQYVMKNAGDALYNMRVNLTKDELVSTVQNAIGSEFSVKENYTTAISRILGDIVEEPVRRRCRKKLDRKALIENFKCGNRVVEQRYISRGSENSERLHMLRLQMFANPVRNEIEGVISVFDVTLSYIEKLMTEYTIKNAYEALALINLRRERINSNVSALLNEESLLDGRNYLMDAIEFCNKYVIEPERESFLNKIRLATLVRELEEKDSYTVDHHIFMDGKIRLMRNEYRYVNKKHGLVILAISDITKDVEHDELTGLYNYKGFRVRANHILTDSKYRDNKYAVLYYNISGFKAINDMYGQEEGDEILRMVGMLLKNSPIKPILNTRLTASDHFVCLAEQSNVTDELLKQVTRMHLTFGGKEVTIYGRIGICNIDDHNVSIETFCDRAKLAKLSIKDQYVQPYAYFTDAMKKTYINKMEVIANLDTALNNGEFKVYLQPIVDAKTGEIASAEALLRWERPGKGIVSPGVFIPALEEHGYITKLDQFVFNTVRAMLKERMIKKLPNVPISVNMSWMDFFDNKMTEHVLQQLSKQYATNQYLRIEVTESSWAVLNEEGQSVLQRLKEYGIGLMLDDFGSGYSSFSTIDDFDFNILKIDMGFVSKIGTNAKSDGIIKSIVAMAHFIGARVCAEGAETEEQVEFLKAAGCDCIQGYYYYRPMPMNDFFRLLDTKRQ